MKEILHNNNQVLCRLTGEGEDEEEYASFFFFFCQSLIMHAVINIKFSMD